MTELPRPTAAVSGAEDFTAAGFHGGGFHGRDFDRRGFFGGYGGFAPDYYGYGTCYLTVYGTTYCY